MKGRHAGTGQRGRKIDLKRVARRASGFAVQRFKLLYRRVIAVIRANEEERKAHPLRPRRHRTRTGRQAARTAIHLAALY